MVTVCCRKRTQVKIIKWRRCRGQSFGEARLRLPLCSLSVESHEQLLILLAIMCDNMYDVLPIRESHLSLDFRLSIGCQWCRHGALMQFLPISAGQSNKAWPRGPEEQKQAFTINLIIGINYLVWSKVSGVQRPSSWAGYSKG